MVLPHARHEHQLGYRLRRANHRIHLFFRPVFRFLFPNFRALHFAYIIGMVLLGSWLIYPCHNVHYVDALFFMSGASTQAGLNTVDGNKIYLYQQIMIYLVTMLTTPIFIHGSLLFVRLYWFEREFDNIKEMSTLNHKMRRYSSLEPTATKENTARNQGIGMHPSPDKPAEGSSKSSASSANSSGTTATSAPAPVPADDHDVTFGDLPRPPSKRADREPQDLYRSIAMLQSHNAQAESVDDAPLVIRPPNEIESEPSRPIYHQRRRSFNFPTSPNEISFPWKKKRPMSKLRRSFTSDTKPASSGDDNDDDDASIDSEAMSDHDDDGDDDDEHSNTHSIRFTGTDRSRRRNPGFNRRAQQLFRETSRLFTNVSGASSRSDDGAPNLSKVMSSNYLSWTPTLGRNSQFINLTEEQKEELGGVEYRATKLLSKVVFVYYVGFHLICMFMLLGWINMHPEFAAKMREQGISPNWWAAFTAQSSFNDLGLTITYDSMVTYQREIYVLLVCSFFIVIGNTAFPVLLRFIIWCMKCCARRDGQLEESLGFLLDHPRRCFTLLFPSGPTWWLFFFVVILNGVDLMLFMVLDLNNPYFDGIPMGIRVVQGLFNAFSTRTAGFSCVDVASLHSSVQVSYVIMMYISVMPIAVTIRRTNVYEEQSLGLYREDVMDSELEKKPKHYIGQHLRNQLSFDLWFIFLGLFIICICENSKLAQGNVRFTAWSILFEVVSAYGTVGMSLGYPDVNTSLTGKFTVLSKLVIIAMMIRGRHRGLPYTLDRAIMLPSKTMRKRDNIQEVQEMRRQQTLDRANTADTRGSGRMSNRGILPDSNFLSRIITGEGAVYQKSRREPHRPMPFSFVPGRPRQPEPLDTILSQGSMSSVLASPLPSNDSEGHAKHSPSSLTHESVESPVSPSTSEGSPTGDTNEGGSVSGVSEILGKSEVSGEPLVPQKSHKQGNESQGKSESKSHGKSEGKSEGKSHGRSKGNESLDLASSTPKSHGLAPTPKSHDLTPSTPKSPDLTSTSPDLSTSHHKSHKTKTPTKATPTKATPKATPTKATPKATPTKTPVHEVAQMPGYSVIDPDADEIELHELRKQVQQTSPGKHHLISLDDEGHLHVGK
ncbi:low-affinity potassium transport protein [Diutina catenulata]